MRTVSASLVVVLCAAVTTATGDVSTGLTEETPPALGLYSVKNEKGVVCLLAEVAVRLLLKTSPQDDNIMLKIFNINPNVTRSSGSCSENKANLRLDFPEGFVQMDMKKVNGIAVANSIEAYLNYSLSDKYQVFTGKVDNLKARMSRADMSYICKVEQAINLSESISVSASNLHLQAFGVQNNTFSSASECSLDHAIPASTTTPTAQSPLNVMPPPFPPVGKYNVSNSEGKVCALFDFSLLVVVNYTMKDNKTGTGFMAVLPNMTNTNGSCHKSHTVLFLHNGNGSFIFNFTKVDNASKFILKNITVQFNNSFHSAKTDSYNASNSSLQMFATSIGKAYLCHLKEIVQLDSNISLHLKQVHVQPFDVKGGKFSESNECKQDHSTPAPITTPPAPITTPTPTPPPLPPVGNYNVSSNGTISALFKFSLLIIVNYTNKDNKTNNGYIAVYPNMTIATGNATGQNKTVLSLKYKNCSTNFTFTMDKAAQKFILQRIDINATYRFPSAKKDTYIGTNSTLQLFTAKVGNSYLCVDEKTVTLSSGITLHMSNVQLQPFHVNDGKFGTAENCTSDIAGLLIPIIVGAVLALLLLIVLIVYLIGRRRSHAGYQAI